MKPTPASNDPPNPNKQQTAPRHCACAGTRANTNIHTCANARTRARACAVSSPTLPSQAHIILPEYPQQQ
jgi:hypothetical protein